MAENNLANFSFEDKLFRVIDVNGGAWFVLNEVCTMLGISNPRDAAARLDDDEKGNVTLTDLFDIERADVGITDISSFDIEQKRNYTIINESGLYALVFTSRKSNAKAFRKWITNEVIPSIRKTGHYNVNTLPPRLNSEHMANIIYINYGL